MNNLTDLIMPPGAYLSQMILQVGTCLRGGIINFRGPWVYQKQDLILFFNIKYFDLNVNWDGIKEEKVGQLFLSNISTYEQTNSLIF